MAKVSAAWGIDIGQCGLKAIRCRRHEDDPTKIVADAFDYIEYPKILTQPEADPEQLVSDALKLFLSRNSVVGDKVAVSAAGQSGLARFIKLPPVETKRIPDIVRYEAKQQIPFDLEDVIWDYQRMGGGLEEDEYALEIEVGLFAMKRDQVDEAVRPLIDAGIDVEIVQLTPLAIYNAMVFDRFDDMIPEEDYDPGDPPPSLVAISIGTETTDLVITNGFRVWQRNIPIGGSHFTRSLTKDLNLTYAKAEHLKRNAAQAEDPKAIYQAMRAVFKDFLTEIQRSIGYFQSLDRAATIKGVVAMGNSMKLPGLKRYLSQNLGHEIDEVNSFHTLTGSAVVDSPAFNDNALCFGVAYGLGIQGLGLGQLSTNLVPRELIVDRIVRQKQPWAVATVAVLMLGIIMNFLVLWWPASQVRVEVDEYWKQSVKRLKDVNRDVDAKQKKYLEAKKLVQDKSAQAEAMMSHFKRRTRWLELVQAINVCLPQNGFKGTPPKDVIEREQIHLSDLRVERFADLAKWATPGVQAARAATLDIKAYPPGSRGAAKSAKSAAQPKAGPRPQGRAGRLAAKAREKEKKAKRGGETEKVVSAGPAPSGPGYVVQFTGYHFYCPAKTDPKKNDLIRAKFVKKKLIENLANKEIPFPDPDSDVIEMKSMSGLGVSYPVFLREDPMETILVPNPDRKRGGTSPKETELVKYNFVVQFVWEPNDSMEEPVEEEKTEAKADGDGDADGDEKNAEAPGDGAITR